MKNKVEPIDKDVMKKFMSGNMTTNEVNSLDLLNKIEARCDYIVRFIWENQKGRLGWWDFDNEGGEDGASGHFDLSDYNENVGYTGSFSGGCDNLYSDYFPTQWIWENFEDEFLKECEDNIKSVLDAKQHAKDLRIKRAEKKKMLIESALLKVTPEEARALGYRPRKVKA